MKYTKTALLTLALALLLITAVTGVAAQKTSLCSLTGVKLAETGGTTDVEFTWSVPEADNQTHIRLIETKGDDVTEQWIIAQAEASEGIHIPMTSWPVFGSAAAPSGAYYVVGINQASGQLIGFRNVWPDQTKVSGLDLTAEEICGQATEPLPTKGKLPTTGRGLDWLTIGGLLVLVTIIATGLVATRRTLARRRIK